MVQRGFLMKTENFAVQFEDVATIHDKRRFNARIAHTIEQALERRQSNDSTPAAVSRRKTLDAYGERSATRSGIVVEGVSSVT